jgi:hypothetical protein
MRNGYVIWHEPEGFSAMPLGKHLAGIMSGTLAMSVRDGLPLTQTYENWYLRLADFYVPNTIQSRE